MNELKIFNSLSNKKELFSPIDNKNITVYACGPTVYDELHVGNARSLVVFDLLYRVLKNIYGKNNVRYVRNITDIDDKIIEAAKKNKISTSDLTKKITKLFHRDCANLNCLKPTFEPKATEHIKEMIEMVDSLIKKKFAYSKNGQVFFEVSKFEDYGKLSNKKIDKLIAGARVEVSSEKKNHLDFVLWKPSDVSEPGWDSPWGRGRPGWHLECSVMSEKYLGKKFDIHGGGIDLIFPHHENEIAQSCSNNSSTKFANYWMHNGFLNMNKEKMSKSLGNIVKINDAIINFSGQVVRLALISAHYKQPLDWNDDLLLEQKNILDKWYQVYDANHEYNYLSKESLSALLDDLNTPAYISELHDLFKAANKGNDKKRVEFNLACKMIGLLNETPLERKEKKKLKIRISDNDINKLIKERNLARKKGNFSLADSIRKKLFENGIVIEDEKDKTSWKYK